MRRPWLLLLLLAMASACHKNAQVESVHDEVVTTRAESRRGASRSSAAPPSPPPPPMEMMMADDSGTTNRYIGGGAINQSGAPPARPVPPSRMVHYDGWAELRATDPAEVVDQIAAIGVGAGGRVDHLSANNVTIRVPAGRFSEIWELVLALTDVVEQQVRAEDVTEQYLAVELRVRTLRETQARLVRLLARAQSEEEKLALLQHITRVTEDLDRTESQMRTLADLAAMSRISAHVTPRRPLGGGSGRAQIAGFAWIDALSPFHHTTGAHGKRIALPVPPELVSLSDKGPFIAESADGAVLWTHRVDNDPVGDGAFWVSAIEGRLAEDFVGQTRRSIGRWDCLSLDEPGSDEPYRWMVCVAPAGKFLEVAQVFLENPGQVARYGEPIEDALSAGGAS